MPKVYFTKEGMDAYMRFIGGKEKEIGDLQGRLGHLAEVGGDQYHDNFSFEQQMREIGMLNAQLANLKKVLQDALVIDLKKSSTEVVIGSEVVIDRDGVEEEWQILGYGESDIDANKMAYDAPLAQFLLGKTVNTTFSFQSSTITIKLIR